MRPTEQLKQEHVAIKTMLQVLDRVSGKLDSGEPVSPEHLEQIAEFIKVFADRCHHGKEEGLLFPAMAEAGIPTEGGPIGVMLQEHDIGRGYVKGMAEAISEYKAGDRNAASRIVENARGYIALLEQHIDKEDNILYPMADMHLAEPTERRLLEEFDRMEREEIGQGRHEEFHELLGRLSRTYLR